MIFLLSPQNYQLLKLFAQASSHVNSLDTLDRERAKLLVDKGFLTLKKTGLSSDSDPYVSRIYYKYSWYTITPSGIDALLDFEQNQKERAEQKRKYDEQIAKADEDRKKQFKHDWLVAIFSAVIGFILGLIVEHFIDIVAFFF